ncbi:uncharacterized protein N7459_007973 [Penicillium hispanicum]|uniref:uncharacterized protein n=1 Tax=Penicillium hispanicum TaxID=1080232 RepID=UPI00253FD6E3|nr:uncharacterized protein N7459_007973 [Penicillium hispanicum]KAJ5573546.1 hypothetical protein N7459_007973 [Penicillium hispanicum]
MPLRTLASSSGSSRLSDGRSGQSTSTEPTSLDSNRSPYRKEDAGARAHKRKSPTETAETQGEPRRTRRTRATASPKPPPTVGSPWDPTERRIVNVEALDLNKSYVNIHSPRALAREPHEDIPRPPRQKRWIHHGNVPLTDIARLPPDWNSWEDDLDPNDYESQIVRCKERIQDGIMPHLFQQRLKEFEQVVSRHRQMALNEPRGLRWAVIQRLYSLKQVQVSLEARGDPNEQLPNVKAIIDAYRTRRLDWHGLVTYWSKGKRLCEPRPFDSDEFDAINVKYDGRKSFWVEGLVGPGPMLQLHGIKIDPGLRYPFVYSYMVAIRFPGYEWWTELEFIHDTGSSMMGIFEGDFVSMMGPHRPGQAPNLYPIRAMGTYEIETGNGKVIRDVITIEVTLLDPKKKLRLCPWTSVQCAVRPGNWDPERHRNDGPWIRTMLYTGTSPSQERRLHISNSRRTLKLPGVDDNKRRRPADLHYTTPYSGPGRVLQEPAPPYPDTKFQPREFPRGFRGVRETEYPSMRNGSFN